MRHHRMNPTFVLFVIVANVATGRADECERFGAIPGTISAEAQDVLRESPLVDPDNVRPTRPLEKIVEDRDAYDVLDDAYSTKALKRYSATVEELAPIKAEKTNVGIHVITPNTINKASERFALIWIHGGGFVLGSPDKMVGAGVPISSLTGVRTYSVGYRLPPEHPFPAGLNDCLAVYRRLIKKYKPRRIGVFGASAGGNLAVALVLKARQENLPLPGCVVAITPWTDLEQRGDSYHTLAGKDPILQSYEAIEWCVNAYAGVRRLRDPAHFSRLRGFHQVSTNADHHGYSRPLAQ